MLRLLLAAPVAWLSGVGVYALALRLLWGRSMMGGDADVVLLSSAAALLVAIPLAYWPVLTLLRLLMDGFRPRFIFSAYSALIGIVPTAMINFYWGGCVRDLLSPESLLFYCLFAAVGVVLGTAFTLRRGSDNGVQPIDGAFDEN